MSFVVEFGSLFTFEVPAWDREEAFEFVWKIFKDEWEKAGLTKEELRKNIKREFSFTHPFTGETFEVEAPSKRKARDIFWNFFERDWQAHGWVKRDLNKWIEEIEPWILKLQPGVIERVSQEKPCTER